MNGCDHAHQAQGFCAKHYYRWKTYGDPLTLKTRENGAGYRGVNNNGYVVLKLRGQTVLEHRQVMEAQLGRKLYPFENVHHKNGIKTDNDPANLEVWVKVQPCGQRVEDLLSFLVEYYPAELREAASHLAGT